MGTWGPGSFENDEAKDWIAVFEKSPGLKPLEEALRVAAAPSDGFLETGVCQRAMAAAEVVAALVTGEGNGISDGLLEWARSKAGKRSEDFRRLAMQALIRIRTGSELEEIWEDSPDVKVWTATISDLEFRLGA